MKYYLIQKKEKHMINMDQMGYKEMDFLIRDLIYSIYLEVEEEENKMDNKENKK